MTAVPATAEDAAMAAFEGAGAAAGVWAERGRVKPTRQTERTIRRTKPPGRSNRDANPFDPAEGKMVPGGRKFGKRAGG
jgi:hypothetical protein